MSRNGRYGPAKPPQPAAYLSFLTFPTGHRTKHLRIDRFFNVAPPTSTKTPFPTVSFGKNGARRLDRNFSDSRFCGRIVFGVMCYAVSNFVVRENSGRAWCSS